MARAYGARGETRGMLNFRVHMDDTQLIEALKDLQTEGQDELKKLIKEMMVEAKEVAEDLLLSQPISNNSNTTARSVRGVNVGGSENVYVRIADSLTISDDGIDLFWQDGDDPVEVPDLEATLRTPGMLSSTNPGGTFADISFLDHFQSIIWN